MVGHLKQLKKGVRNFDISLRILGLFHKSAAVKWYAVLTGYGDTVENTVENSEPDPGSLMLNEIYSAARAFCRKIDSCY